MLQLSDGEQTAGRERATGRTAPAVQGAHIVSGLTKSAKVKMFFSDSYAWLFVSLRIKQGVARRQTCFLLDEVSTEICSSG